MARASIRALRLPNAVAWVAACFAPLACESPESIDVVPGRSMTTEVGDVSPVIYHARFSASGSRRSEATVADGGFVVADGDRHDRCDSWEGGAIPIDATVTLHCTQGERVLAQDDLRLRELTYGRVADIDLPNGVPFDVDCTISFMGDPGSGLQIIDWRLCGELIVHARGDFDLDIDPDVQP